MVLAVETRVKIIDLIKIQGALGANNIAELVGITPAAVSQHLKILETIGTLFGVKERGYWIPYSLDEEALENCRQILNEVCTCGLPGNRQIQRERVERSKFRITSGVIRRSYKMKSELSKKELKR